jgi:diaminohydroxyphosphoribosylaminopyrimidine deaminase/5-amino-6-(5-phosphoribosylamino)uracil reductase
MNEISEKFILRCFQLAKQALGNTTPNPYVGSVIVKNGEVIAEGFHKKSGLPHAEADALNSLSKNSTENAKGATLYCNLEPCCHTNKKTAPCCDRIIAEGISKVVISNLDPNPEVAGKGIAKLRAAGIEVISGIMEEEGALLNEVFFTHITKHRPFIHLKWAQTLDGKTATTSFDSKWITGETARQYVHQERDLYDAILIGANTLNKDDPKLTVRLSNEKSKKRIVLSPSGKLNLESQLFQDEFKDQTIIVIAPGTYIKTGIKTITCPLDNSGEGFDLDTLLKELYSNGINSIYIEGGSTVINAFLDHKVFDRVSVYIAPKILGQGIQSVNKIKFENMKDCISFEHGTWNQFKQDMLFESKRNICLQDL